MLESQEQQSFELGVSNEQSYNSGTPNIYSRSTTVVQLVFLRIEGLFLYKFFV